MTFRATAQNIANLYTRTLEPCERVLCLDEKTSLQPRTRTANKPAKPGNVAVRLEHEYVRKGALNLFAAFDTRTGNVTAILRCRQGQTRHDRKRLGDGVRFAPRRHASRRGSMPRLYEQGIELLKRIVAMLIAP